MKNTVVLLLLVGLVAMFGCTDETLTPPQVSDAGNPEKSLDVLGKVINSPIPGRYIVVLKDGQGEAGVLAKDFSQRYSFTVDHIYNQSLQGFAGNISAVVAMELRSLPQVQAVEQDRRVVALAQDLPTGADRIEADLSPVAQIDGQPTLVDVDVAIIDSGLDMLHLDLNIGGGIRILGGVQDSDFMDDFGHGTHMGGIVAARDNDRGTVGVAPGARLWGIKVLDGWGLGLLSDVISGVDWVTTRSSAIEVAVLSFGGVGYSPALRTAIQNCVAAGVVVVAAAGNSAQDIFGPDGVFGTDDDIIPAAFPEVATISAFVDTDGRPGGLGETTPYGPDDSFATFSNFARQVVPGDPINSPGGAIDMALPGVQILSTIPGNDYYPASGTSMAAAHAAGLAALKIAQDGRAHNASEVLAIRQALIDNAVAQDAVNGFSLQNDPDFMKEPIGWAIPSQPFADVAVMGFTGPASVVQGDSLALTVDLANLGSLDVVTPFTVSISETITGRVPVSRTVDALAAGATRSATVTINVPADFAPGVYSLVCAHDYDDPNSANDQKELTVEVLEDISTTEQIGLFFDTEGTQDTLQVHFLDFTKVYILNLNPDHEEIDGYECGFDLSKASGAPYMPLANITLPVEGINVGDIDTPAGVYNFVIGYASPLPTFGTTVLTTLEFIILDEETTTADLRGSIPSSVDGSPAIYLTGTMDIIPLGMPTAPGVPDLTFQYGDLDPAPAAPTGLVPHGGQDYPAEITIDWNNNIEPDLAGYNVYRSSQAGGPYSLMNLSGLVLNSVYADDGVPFGVPYYYVITAVDVAGNESAYSVEATATAEDTTSPGPAEIIQAIAGSSQVHLYWTGSSSTDVDHYDVYNGSQSGGPYFLVGNTPGLDFVDSSVANGLVYYYTVKAIDFMGNNSNFSNEISVIPGDQFPETMGIYFDTQGTVTQADAVFLDHVQAYILYSNPSLPAALGFECGVDVVPVVTGTPINTNVVVSYPLAATDVGVSDAAAGAYNFITGFSEPLPTAQQTVLAELDIFYLDSGPLDFYLRASDPETVPISNLPAVIRKDYSIYEVAMASDPASPAMQINSGQPVTGTVVVDPEPNVLNASWILTLPDGEVLNGSGDALQNNVATGTYTIFWLGVADYNTPPSETLVLAGDETIIFRGNYTPLAQNESLGLWFDPDGTQSCMEASFFDHAPAYILYTDPSQANIRGFECGFDLTRAGGAGFNTAVTITYPTPSTDVGTNDGSNGTYNIIVGYGVPVPTSSQTVVATLDIFYLDSEAIHFDLRPAIPASDDSGMPIILKEDYSLLDVQIGSPQATLALPGGCSYPK